MDKSTKGHAEKSPSRRVQRQNTEAVWKDADAAALKSAINAVTAQGGALRFGITQDGGAFAIGVYGDGDPYTEYISCNDDINEYLRALTEMWQ